MFLSLTRVKCRWRLKPFFSSATFSTPTMPLMLICFRFSWSVRGVAMLIRSYCCCCCWKEALLSLDPNQPDWERREVKRRDVLVFVGGTQPQVSRRSLLLGLVFIGEYKGEEGVSPSELSFTLLYFRDGGGEDTLRAGQLSWISITTFRGRPTWGEGEEETGLFWRGKTQQELKKKKKTQPATG